jgi:hypothetical protein
MSCLTRARVAIVACAAVAVLVPGLACALQRNLSVAEQAVIADPLGNSRLLIRFEDFTELQDEWIASATLTIPITGRMPADLDLRIDVPHSDWNSAASWTSPWFEAGGDPEGEQAVVWEVNEGSTLLSADVTHLVRAMQEGDAPDHGFLIWAAGPDRVGLTAPEAAAFQGLGRANLEITYRRFSEHFRVSAAELIGRKRGTARALDQ